jgi:hypothetical protein
MVGLVLKVQKSVCRLNILTAGVNALPAVLTYVIFDVNCDRIGSMTSINHSMFRKNLSDICLILSTVIDGSFGSNSVLLLDAIVYINDCTTK